MNPGTLRVGQLWRNVVVIVGTGLPEGAMVIQDWTPNVFSRWSPGLLIGDQGNHLQEGFDPEEWTDP